MESTSVKISETRFMEWGRLREKTDICGMSVFIGYSVVLRVLRSIRYIASIMVLVISSLSYEPFTVIVVVLFTDILSVIYTLSVMVIFIMVYGFLYVNRKTRCYG